METVMIYPDKKEKAIYNYSEDLLKEIPDVKRLTFIAKKPLTFSFFDDIKQIHIQHEYNLLGWYGTPWFYILPLLKLLNKKIILTMHTVQSKKRHGFVRRTFYSISNWFIKHCSNKIIVHSQVFKDILVNEYGFNESKISVIRHGVKEVPKFNKGKIRKELGFKKDELIYLIIGTFHPDHQPHLVINNTNYINATILVVWNSNKGKRIVDYFNETFAGGIPKNVKIIDLAKEHKDMWWEFFYAADRVVLPYIDGIGSGIFQDAMATRTPVICSDTAYFREMLEGFTTCDAYAKKYSVRNMAKLTRRVYETK